MAQKDFGTMKTNVGNEVLDTSSSFATKAGVFINNRYFDVLDRLKFHDLFEAYRTITIVTTAAVKDYVLPFDFGTPVVYAMDTTNNRTLDIITEQEWAEKFSPAITTTGAPIVMMIRNDSTVRLQPTSASQIKAISTSSSDTTQTMVIRGISGSAEFYETVTLNGTASAASSNTYDYVLQLAKSAATTGVVTISYVADSGVGAVIGPDSTEARYNRSRFHYVPAGTYSIDVRYPRRVMPLLNSDDTPLVDIADIVEIGAKSEAWRSKRQFANAADFDTLYERALDRYINQRLSGMVHQFDVKPARRTDMY